MKTQAQPQPHSLPAPAVSDQREEMVRLTLELPFSLHQALALQAVMKRTSKAAIIRRLLQESLQNDDA